MSSFTDKFFIIWSKSSGIYTKLGSILTKEGWQIFITGNVRLLSQFGSDEQRLVCLAILGPVGAFGPDEIHSIVDFISCGHKAFIAHSASDQEGPPSNNINELVKLFGVSFNEDCVIRPNPFKLYHPSEAMLEDFVANRGLGDSLAKFVDRKINEYEPIADLIESPDATTGGARIIYPQGCTLNIISKGCTIMMTSSKWALPSCQPICAFYQNEANKARMILLGSQGLLTDDYIDKENNKSLVMSFLDFLSNEDFQINVSDARTLELPENNMTPDMDSLVDTPISAIQQLESLPQNPSSLIDRRLFSLDNSKLPEVLRAYTELRVENRPLTLMRPLVSWRRDGSMVTKDQLKFILRRDDGTIELM